MEINFTKRARKIIEKIEDFPEEHFKLWWKHNYGNMGSGHVSVYLEDPKGYDSGKIQQMSEKGGENRDK